MSVDLNLAFYSVLGKTKKGELPKNVVKVRDEKDLGPDGVPRFEPFRGVSGEVVYDLREYKGVVSYDENSVTVRSGTTWEEVLSQFPDVITFSVMEFSVGGSVYFDDPIFGFNEFRSVRTIARVKAFSKGKLSDGNYIEGIPLEVTLRRYKEEIVNLRADLGFADRFLSTLVNWASSILLFRDVTFVKRGGVFAIHVSYPKVRESLVSKALSEIGGWEEVKTPFRESVKSIKKLYWYYGIINSDLLRSLEQLISSPDVDMVIRLRRGTALVSIYSDSPLSLPKELALLPFSDDPGTNSFTSNCIMCGKCLEVCPHVKLKGGIAFSPLGFYSLKGSYDVSEITTCSYCGACESVCPMGLQILNDFSSSAKFGEVKGAEVKESSPGENVLLITDISSTLQDEIRYALIYLESLGIEAKMFYYPKPFKELLLRRESRESVQGLLGQARSIYVITPEEYRVFKQYLPNANVVFVQEHALGRLNKGLKVHEGCYYNLKTENCSYALLDLLTGKTTEVSLNFEASLCPFAANKLGIKTPLSMLFEERIGKYKREVQAIIDAYRELLKKYKEEIEWYEGLDEGVVELIKENAMSYAVKSRNISDVNELIGLLESITLSSEEEKLLLQALKKVTKT